MQKYILLFLILFGLGKNAHPQFIPEHIKYTNIYEFLDELANEQIIDLNTTVKPYSKVFIGEKLREAANKADKLNSRQKKEIAFFQQIYNPEYIDNLTYTHRFNLVNNSNTQISLNPAGIFYHDEIFNLSIKPIAGYQNWSNDHGSVSHRWNGAEAYATVGKNWGFYASLRDNHESRWLNNEAFLNQRQGVPVKNFGDEGIDYSEMRGGITYAWDWGSIGLIKDHFSWGNNSNGANIFSGKSPSFAHLSLHLQPVKWFDFHYVHGWLVSEVIDSARTYLFNTSGQQRVVFHDKYLAANLFTITPFERFSVSFGNSIIYSDIGVHPAYLIPFLFYKSVDHTLNSTSNYSGQNAQMFFELSSRNIKHLHVFTTLFLDEISIERMMKEDEHSNFYSLKAGLQLSNFPVKNISFAAEYTRTNPITYQHFIPTTSFASNSYNLGHYLRDNSDEIYLAVHWKPLRGLRANLSYTHSRHGGNENGEEILYGGGISALGLPFMETVIWENNTMQLDVIYEFMHNGFVFIQLINSDITGNVQTYTPELFHGQNLTLSTGINYGF